MAAGKARSKETNGALTEKMPEVWPFPTYKGRPYKPPKRRVPKPVYEEALF